jgi:peptidoglycan/LPS O-acetylase OafA/YrhL
MSQSATPDQAAPPRAEEALPSQRHLPRLDGLRGVAIALVMLHHFTIYSGMRRESGLDGVYYALGESAWWGVDLFFVLSGFLITGILLDSRGGPGYFRSFYARRALRIFPLYYGVLFIVLWLLPRLVTASPAFAGELEAQGWYWTYLVNVRTAREGWPAFPGLAHFWSLAVEEQFYLVWPAVVLLCDRRRLPQLCLALIGASLLLRTGLTLTAPHHAGFLLMPARLEALALGALLAAASRDRHWWALIGRWLRPGAALAAAALVIVFVGNGGLIQEQPIVRTVGLTLVAVLSAGLLVMALDSRSDHFLSRTLESASLRFLGRYSYGLYVFHHLLVFQITGRLLDVARIPRLAGSQLPGQLLYLIVATGASLAVALVSWHCWEQPFLRLKRRFPYSRGAPVR